MSPEHPRNPRDQLEASEEILTAAERCLTALFDMADVDKVGAYQPCSRFFAALNGSPSPEDLRTNIHLSRVHTDDETFSSQIFPGGAAVIATVSIGFDSSHIRDLHNVDFVRTDDGLKAYEKDWFTTDSGPVARYGRALDEAQLFALSADASQIAQTIIDTDAERLKLGPLAEEAGPDGLRRFHVGDILSVITHRILSPRGVSGMSDILEYMTNEVPHTTQLGRFSDECKPYLQAQFDNKLADFYEPPETALVDAPSLYRWLGKVGQIIGEPLLVVTRVTQDRHARVDFASELELDRGSDFMKKVITFDPEESDEI